MIYWRLLLCCTWLALQVSESAHSAAKPAATPATVAATGSTPPPAPAGASATEQHNLTKSDVDAWLDGYMPYALREGDIPGAVVAVVKDGQILTARGFGFADLDKRTPVDPERTLFRPGSVSKLVTWTAVMQMVEQHKLDLDHDINAYLDFKIPSRDGQPVTLRQLMTHTGGFEETAKSIIYYDTKYLIPLDAYLKRWVPERIFAPGTTPAYSNWGTALAAYMVQRASGEPFEDYVEHHIFAPLGMSTATFRQPLPADRVAQLATGYAKPGQSPLGFELLGPWPAGSLSVSGADMARFMIAHLQGGELGGQRILSAATAQTMHDSPLDAANPMSLIPPLNRMELGFFETNINGREVIGHLGDTEGFHTSLHLFMKDGVGFYVSFNSPGKAGAVQPLRNWMFMDFADRYFPDVGPADGHINAKSSAEHATLLQGVWEVSRRSESNFLALLGLIGQTKVAVGPKGELIVPSLVGANGRPRDWVEIGPFVWRDRNGHDRIAAKLVDGKVVRWSMDFLSPFEVFDRVPTGKSGAWLMPGLYASLAVLTLTFLSWPIGWWVRRRFNAPLPLTGSPLKGYRAVRLFAGLSVAVLAGWAVAIAMMLASLSRLAGAFDPVLWLLQFAGAVAFVGAVLASAWNVKLVWTGSSGWARKLWSVLLLLASTLVLYTAVRFGLLAFTVKF